MRKQASLMKRILFVALLVIFFTVIASPAFASTWYIRTDGGTSLQCTGLTNAAYTGGTSAQWSPNTVYTVGMTVADEHNRLQAITTAGVSGTRFEPTWGTTVGATSTSPNGGTEVWTAGAALTSSQNCAVNNPIWLTTHNNSSTTAFAWVTAANDIIKFEDVGPYYLGSAINGMVGASWEWCVGNEANCVLPALPNGTHLLGLGSGACHTSNSYANYNPATGTPLTNATKLLLINDAYDGINLSTTNNADVECFDVSQPDVCTSEAGTAVQGTITHTALASGTATYSVTTTSSPGLMAIGMLVKITGTTNGGGALNVTGNIATLTGSAPSYTFTLTGISGSATSASDTGTMVFAGTCVLGVNNYGQTGVLISDHANVGASNLSLHDMYIHGISSRGLGGAHFNTSSGDISNLSDIYMFGNGGINYDGDGQNGNTGSESIGTINWTNIQSWWAGCIDNHSSGTVNYCIDQTYGGAGDNLVMIAAGNSTWNWTNIKAMYGTQDGFDSLHTGDDPTNAPTTIVTHAYSEGNEGASLKGGAGAQTTFKNSIGVASCDAITSGTVGSSNPTGWNALIGLTCRAGDGASFALGPNSRLELDNDTFVGKQATSLDIGDIASGAGLEMTSSTVVVMRNTTFMGFNNSSGPVGGIFLNSGNGINPFANVGSIIDHNAWFNMKSNSFSGSACPQNPVETHQVCGDPKFTAEASVYAFNPIPLSGSPLLGAGITYTGIPTTDFFGVATTSPPVIGAANFSSGGSPTLSTVTVTPGSASTTIGGHQTFVGSCLYSDSSTTPCTITWTDTNAHSTVGSTTGIVTGVSVGSDTITATFNSVSGTATISVTSPGIIVFQKGNFVRKGHF